MIYFPLCPLLQQQNKEKMSMLTNHSLMVLADFDGTISQQDVTDLVLEHFADPHYEEVEQEWLDGKIGSKSCMTQQIELLNVTKTDLDAFLKTVAIDSYFKQFINYLKQKNILLQVVSDGLDYAIQSILAEFDLPIYANQLQYDGKNNWKMAFPYSISGCLKESGNCKCHHLAQQRQLAKTIFYIGDGSSDFCVAHHADLIFAKDKLIDYCKKNNLPHIAIRHFGDVQTYLEQYFLENGQLK